MPLVVLCGQPCSGKSTLALQLSARLQELGLVTTIIDEPSLHLERNTSYSNLAGRFERPDARNRWDAPLFTVQPGRSDVEENIDAILHHITAAPEGQVGGAPLQITKALTPTVATSNQSLLATNTLHDVDQAAQDLINVIMDAQASSAAGAAGIVHVADTARPLELSQPVTLAELRRHKRAFLKLATKSTFTRIQDPETARRMFSDYLRDNIGT